MLTRMSVMSSFSKPLILWGCSAQQHSPCGNSGDSYQVCQKAMLKAKFVLGYMGHVRRSSSVPRLDSHVQYLRVNVLLIQNSYGKKWRKSITWFTYHITIFIQLTYCVSIWNLHWTTCFTPFSSIHFLKAYYLWITSSCNNHRMHFYFLYLIRGSHVNAF